ncbi:MAG: glycosyltransferase family 9 protein [Ignavibacteriales bacterium]|nr:glycosyltransferase family 9 protein [Ignavibacteriales bacterium]
MHNFNNILIIRFGSLGDIILASPLIRVVRAAYPLAHINFLVKSQYAELLKCNPYLSSIIELKTSGDEELKNLKKSIQATRYDLILDIHNSLRSQRLRFFSHARRIRVVNKRVMRRFALVHLKRNYYKNLVSVADRYLETVRSFGIKDDGQGLEVFVPDETISSVRATMSKYKLEKYDIVIGLAPAAQHFTKRWPQERFVEFGVQAAKAWRIKILIFGSREERDYCGDIAQMINARAGSSLAESLAGTFSLLETAAALDFCTVVVSNDTGIMHLAAARKRKVVGIFGSTVRELGFFPYGTRSVVVENKGLGCRPCSHIGLDHCPEGHFRCMLDIHAGEVVSAMENMLNSH